MRLSGRRKLLFLCASIVLVLGIDDRQIIMKSVVDWCVARGVARGVVRGVVVVDVFAGGHVLVTGGGFVERN